MKVDEKLMSPVNPLEMDFIKSNIGIRVLVAGVCGCFKAVSLFSAEVRCRDYGITVDCFDWFIEQLEIFEFKKTVRRI